MTLLLQTHLGFSPLHRVPNPLHVPNQPMQKTNSKNLEQISLMARSREVRLSTLHKLGPYLDGPKAKVHGFLRPLINGKPKQRLEVCAMARQCALDVPLDVEM